MVKQVVTEKTPGLEITLTPCPEDTDPADHFASDEPEADAEMVAEIRRRSNNGDPWAWFVAKVEVSYNGIIARDYLGGCTYADEKDFRDGGYYADMVFECLKQLNAQLDTINACELAPHNRAILACACGYKRNNGNGR